MIYPGECSTYTWEECWFCYLFWSVSFYLVYHVVYDQCFLIDFLYGSIHWWKWSVEVLYYYYTVSPLHTNLQCANFLRCEHASGSSKGAESVSSISCMSEIAASPLSPIADDSSALPSPTFSPSSSPSFQEGSRRSKTPSDSSRSIPAPVCQMLHGTAVLLHFSRYWTIRFKCFLYFLCLFFRYYWVKSIIKLLEYYTANCVSWVPRLISGFPGDTCGKEPTANAGGIRDTGFIPGPGRSPGGENASLLQCSCLENPMHRGAW